MPRVIHETTDDRKAELDRRELRARAAVAAISPRATEEKVHVSRSQARAAASRCGCPNTEIDADEAPMGFVGVVCLRPDQEWMRRQVEERGCRVRAI